MPIVITDTNNVAAAVSYNAFGWLKSVRRPGDETGTATAAINYAGLDKSWSPGHDSPYWTEAIQKVNASTSFTVRKYYNGMGQLLQTQVVTVTLTDNACSADGDTNPDTCGVLVDYYYNDSGSLVRQTVPLTITAGGYYHAAEHENMTRPAAVATYDVLGRTRRETAPDNTYSETSYYDLETRQRDERGNYTRYLQDVWGRTVQVIPLNGSDVNNPILPSVSYTYDAADRLLQAARGTAVTSLSYDLAGRKTQMVDGDMGTWSYTYDALGNLVTQKDARCTGGSCVTTTLTYDLLNRLTGKSYTIPAGLNVEATTAVQYFYDEGGAAAYANGRRTRMTDSSGSTTWTYDARGRITSESKTITGPGTFKTEWGYNSADLVEWMKYPSNNTNGTGEKVTYSYLSQMALSQLSSDSGTPGVPGDDYSYVQQAQYDAAGRINLLKLGSPIIQVNYTYNAWNVQGGRLQSLNAIKLGTPPTMLQNLSYTYDAEGNIKTILDGDNSNQKQCFQYDNLDRLTQATTYQDAAQGCSTQLGNGNYNETYTYDSNGNLSNKAGVTYGYNDSAHKHAVTHLGAPQKYWYDANGNMIKRIGSSTFELFYDAENRLVRVKKGSVTNFALLSYDGDGKRVKSIINGTTIAFVSNYFEWSGSTSTMVKYYYSSSQRIAMRTGTGSGTSGLIFLLGDHLGSTSVSYQVDTAQKKTQLYYPWGSLRYPTTYNMPTKYGYTGQYSNTSDFGLIFYNARWYEPGLGRFAQADSIVPDISNPADFDRYAYVRNSPLNFVDPSGHACEDLPQGSREACINARNALYPPTTTPKSTSTPTPTYYINFNLQSEFTSIIGKVGLENGTVSNVLDSVSTFLDSVALAIDGLIAGGDIGTGL